MSTLADDAHALQQREIRTWSELRASHAALASASVRVFDFGEFTVRAQLNPGRTKLASSKVDPQSISARPCFLCDANRPAEQVGIEWKYGYKVLNNPFPILPEHFTIVQTQHVPQRIAPAIRIMLKLARDLAGRYTVFYNGAQCGASAPDHLHFQAGPAGFIPIDSDFDRVKQLILESGNVRTYTAGNYLRRFIGFESPDLAELECAFLAHHARQQTLQSDAIEPKMNVFCRFENSTWRLIAFLRAQHRPSYYSLPEPQRMLISPGAIDAGGIIVLPRENDFHRINQEIVADVYRQISITDDQFRSIAPLPAGT